MVCGEEPNFGLIPLHLLVLLVKVKRRKGSYFEGVKKSRLCNYPNSFLVHVCVRKFSKLLLRLCVS